MWEASPWEEALGLLHEIRDVSVVLDLSTYSAAFLVCKTNPSDVSCKKKGRGACGGFVTDVVATLIRP